MSDPMDAFRASGITAEQAVANWVSAVKASLQPREKPPMTNLADWLLAQIATDEAAAQCVHDIDCDIHRGFADERGDCDCGEPARVLAECAAKRAIVELHAVTVKKVNTAPFDAYTGEPQEPEYEVDCAVCGWASATYRRRRLTLRLLAQMYADREGFDPAWRT